MNTSNDSKASAPLGVRAEIDMRLAKIGPEQYIVPPIAREEGAHFVVMASDEVKRLFTLYNQLRGKGMALALRGLQIARSARRDFNDRGADEIIKELKTTGSPTLNMRAELDRLRNEVEQGERLEGIVKALLWEEVRRQHPDLEFKPTVAVYSDWSLCWKEDEDEDLAAGLLAALGLSRLGREQ